MSQSRHVDNTGLSDPSRRDASRTCRTGTVSASYRGAVAKHFTEETAEFAMPRIGRHAAPDTGELDVTQPFDPGFRQQRPVPWAAQRRRDEDAR